MKRFSTFLLLFVAFQLNTLAQDFLTVPNSNPSLFQKEQVTNEKIRVFESNFIYQYDTLPLPFIDDFSEDHFPIRVTDTADSRLTDTIAFAILDENGVAFPDTFGFTTDTTFNYLLGSSGDTIRVELNPSRKILHTLLDSNELVYREHTVFPAYDIHDTLGGVRDTIPLSSIQFEQDTLQFFLVAPNPNDYYTDRSTLLNNTFAIEPPSIGVVTFDGLDEFGLPYDIDFDLRVMADEMTSVPIDLSGLTEDDSVYFSFFYQPQGRSIDRPEREDSLVLEFYNSAAGKWASIWQKTGEGVKDFEQLLFLVTDTFLNDAFRFRFRNYASSTGAFDQWHIDYLYLDQGRNRNDTVYKDLAYLYDAPSLLKEFYAMPWFHFNNNPSAYMADTAVTVVKNRFNQSLSVFNKIVVPDEENGTNFYQFPTDNNSFVVLPENFLIDFQYPLNGFEFPAVRVDTAVTFESTYDIDFRPLPGTESDFIRSNDTLIGRTVLENFYAYDDGTAEAGYGINPTQSTDGRTAYMAVEFDIPFVDTLGGIQLYFLPQTFDIRNQSFVITVWNSSLNPSNIVYEKTVSSSPFFSDDNGYLNYSFDKDTTVLVNQKFFVGFKAIGRNSLNVGYDLNSNSRSRIFWSQDGVGWNNPSNGIRDGSLMLRPIFREKILGVGLGEILGSNNTKPREIKLYPNPANNSIKIEFTNNANTSRYEVLDLNGRVIQTNILQAQSAVGFNEYNYQEEIEVSNLTNGVYFLTIFGENGTLHRQKFIVQH